jgi:hypothetical protein
MIISCPTSRQFHTISSTSNRTGPHNIDVISVLVGCLLGDAYAAKSKKDIPGTKVRLKQSGRHKAYLFFLYEFFLKRGYCTNTGPREYKTILINAANKKQKPKTYYGYEFNVFTYSSLNWLYDLFYLNGIKFVSSEIINYLTPMSIAFLIMDDGGWVSGYKSVRIATNSFSRPYFFLLFLFLLLK